MSPSQPGYMGKLLRVDLTTKQITEETPDEATLRKYLGGIGLATKRPTLNNIYDLMLCDGVGEMV